MSAVEVSALNVNRSGSDQPYANDSLKDNLNAVGRVYYSFSTLLCTLCSRSQEVGGCLRAQAGEEALARS
jgi:uncharacterized protein (DUF488 family)